MTADFAAPADLPVALEALELFRRFYADPALNLNAAQRARIAAYEAEWLDEIEARFGLVTTGAEAALLQENRRAG